VSIGLCRKRCEMAVKRKGGEVAGGSRSMANMRSGLGRGRAAGAGI
jgi:hypothetical protein